MLDSLSYVDVSEVAAKNCFPTLGMLKVLLVPFFPSFGSLQTHETSFVSWKHLEICFNMCFPFDILISQCLRSLEIDIIIFWGK